MYKDVLNHMTGAENFATVGLVIFFSVFVLILLNAAVRSKRDVAAWSCMPLGEDEQIAKQPEVDRE